MTRFPGLLAAGAKSGAGKTCACLGLIAALRQRGLRIFPAKAGPDYLDAAWLAAASGVPALNIDLIMAGAAGFERIYNSLARNFQDKSKGYDALIVEGAMGLFDGTFGQHGSSAELAWRLGLPVLLVLDGKGCAQSIGAIASGFLNWRPEWLKSEESLKFCGIAVAHAGSEKHRSLMEETLGPVCRRAQLPPPFFLPAQGAPSLASRHLGLVQARESANNIDFNCLGEWFAENAPLDEICLRAGIELPKSSSRLNRADAGKQFFEASASRASGDSPVVGIAHDDAFSFCYADLPAILQEIGARVVFFSPLRDALPVADAFYFPGGYPEIYAAALTENRTLLTSLTIAARQGTPIYGECGGCMYLGASLTDASGKIFAMANLLPLSCTVTPRLQSLGYRAATLNAPANAGRCLKATGHEFHYGRMKFEKKIRPLWTGEDMTGEPWRDGCIVSNVMGGWLHLYPEGSRDFWSWFLNLAADRQKGKYAS